MGRGKHQRAPVRAGGRGPGRQQRQRPGRHRLDVDLKARRRALLELLERGPLDFPDGRPQPDGPLAQYALIVEDRIHLYEHCDAVLAHIANEQEEGPAGLQYEVVDLDSGQRLDPSFLVSLRAALG